MPSTPSTLFSTTTLTLIYLIVGDFAFCLTRLALSYELFKQLLYISASAIAVRNVARSLEIDETTVMVAEETSIETEQLHLAGESSEATLSESDELPSNEENSVATLSEDTIGEDDDEEPDATLEEEAEVEIEDGEEPEPEEDEEALQQQAEQDALAQLRSAIPAGIRNLNPFGNKPCVGTTKKGASCGQMMFSNYCRSQASTLLEKMLSDNPGTSFELDELTALAGNLLCPRWHRGVQDYQVARMWYNQLHAARAALVNLEDAKEWGRELCEKREAEKERQRLLSTPTASRFSSSFEVGTPESDLSRTLSRSPSRSPAVSISAASSTASSRRSSLSVASDETPSLYGSEKQEGRKSGKAASRSATVETGRS